MQGNGNRTALNTFEKIYAQVQRIPYGKVATYGLIAKLAGNPRWSQIVGYALHVNPDPANIKCYRIVNREGKLSPTFAFGGTQAQAQLLRNEGIEVSPEGYVDLEKYLVSPNELLEE